MKAFMNWSGGKDSSLCLYKAQQSGIPVQALVTNVNSVHNRISMHGVRRNLLERQAASVQLPLYTAELPEQPGMETFETTLQHLHARLKSEGFTHAVYGDIFLEDLKQYRENFLGKDGLQGLFPLWKIDSTALLKEFLSLGFKAITVCVHANYLDQSFCGRLMDESFFNDLPATVDPCGENGEYHSFVFDGPLFTKPIRFSKGELTYKEYAAPKDEEEECFSTTKSARTGFYFCDLIEQD